MELEAKELDQLGYDDLDEYKHLANALYQEDDSFIRG
jgi:hypothetical protein